MRGVDVQVFGSSSELRAAMAREAPDGVLGPSAVVKGLGLQPAVLGVGPKVSWVAATLKAGLTRAELAGLTVGVVEDASKKVVEDRVGELVGGKPRVRRVPKTDDLLPLLQLKMADAVVVREADLAELRARTQQTVHVVPLGGVDSTRALAFTEGSRRSVVERAVLGLGADVRAQLGVEKWSKE
jgi:ABC-type amino acid transport substrate-binding protein